MNHQGKLDHDRGKDAVVMDTGGFLAIGLTAPSRPVSITFTAQEILHFLSELLLTQCGMLGLDKLPDFPHKKSGTWLTQIKETLGDKAYLDLAHASKKMLHSSLKCKLVIVDAANHRSTEQVEMLPCQDKNSLGVFDATVAYLASLFVDIDQSTTLRKAHENNCGKWFGEDFEIVQDDPAYSVTQELLSKKHLLLKEVTVVENALALAISKREYYFSLIDGIEQVRTRNNVNWMQLLRLAFRCDPFAAKKILKNIHRDDSEISHLLAQLAL